MAQIRKSLWAHKCSHHNVQYSYKTLPAYCKHQFCFGVDDLEQQPYLYSHLQQASNIATNDGMCLKSRKGTFTIRSNYQLIFFWKVISPYLLMLLPIFNPLPPTVNETHFAFHQKWRVIHRYCRVYVIFQTEDLPCFVPFQSSSAQYEQRGVAASRRVASVCGRSSARRPEKTRPSDTMQDIL